MINMLFGVIAFMLLGLGLKLLIQYAVEEGVNKAIGHVLYNIDEKLDKIEDKITDIDGSLSNIDNKIEDRHTEPY